MNFHTVNWHAEQTLRVIQPESLGGPIAVDTFSLVDNCTMLGINIRAASVLVMGTHEGRYYAEDRQILIREDHWLALETGGDGVFRARSTLAHEIGHHVLRDISDDERDAWAFAGCFLMPCGVVTNLEEIHPVNLSRIFCVSPEFATAHLDRMKRARMF